MKRFPRTHVRSHGLVTPCLRVRGRPVRWTTRHSRETSMSPAARESSSSRTSTIIYPYAAYCDPYSPSYAPQYCCWSRLLLGP